MPYTPVELRHIRVSRSLLGYNRSMIEQMIEEVAESFETAWRERGELADRVEALDDQIVELRRREELLTHTLVAAEQTASEVRDRARRTADRMLADAEQERRAIILSAQVQREALLVESRRIEAMLRAALSMIESDAAPASPAPSPPESSAPQPSGNPPEQVERNPGQARLDWGPFVPDIAPGSTPLEPRLPESEEVGWPAEDADEFGAVILPPPIESSEPDETIERRPFLRRIAGEGGRTFDWGG
jgi:hypothetical protein